MVLVDDSHAVGFVGANGAGVVGQPCEMVRVPVTVFTAAEWAVATAEPVVVPHERGMARTGLEPPRIARLKLVNPTGGSPSNRATMRPPCCSSGSKVPSSFTRAAAPKSSLLASMNTRARWPGEVAAR